jgi:serine/threonine protein kinase
MFLQPSENKDVQVVPFVSGMQQDVCWAEVEWESLNVGPILAVGAGSTIFSAQDSFGSRVAVKKPKITEARVISNFLTEVNVLCRLQHANIVSVLAACTKPPHYCMVMPLCSQGSIADAIYIHKKLFSWTEKQSILLQLAEALHHVHSHNILHRDIKSQNILLNDDGSILLTDFELADSIAAIHEGELASGRTRQGRTIGTLVTMAPEILLNRGVNTKKDFVYTFSSDVYAFAVTANEIVSGIMPYSDRFTSNVNVHTVLDMNYSTHTLAAAIAGDHLRPSIATQCPLEFAELITRCWHPVPALRPSFAEIITSLKSMSYLEPAAVAGQPSTLASAPFVFQDNYFLRDKSQALAANAAALAHAIPAYGRACDAAPLWARSQTTRDLQCGVAESCGRRGEDSMEDRHLICKRLFPSSNCTLLAVLDGHGGPAAADFVCKSLPHAISAIANRADVCNASDTLKATFPTISDAFIASGNMTSGCTALVGLVCDNHVVIANAGDCRALLYAGGRCQQITIDHVASNASERAAAQARGGLTSQVAGEWRVNGLEVTRALGDGRCRPGLSCDPDIFTFQIEPDHFFVSSTFHSS